MPGDMVEAHLHGVRNALAAGWRVLERGGPALDAVEEAVVIMEDDETFDAGRGSFLNRDGKVQLMRSSWMAPRYGPEESAASSDCEIPCARRARYLAKVRTCISWRKAPKDSPPSMAFRSAGTKT